MSNDPKQQSHRPEPIGVRVLKFVGNTDIPGRGYTQSVTADKEKPKNRDHYTIEFMPWLRHHRITLHQASGESAVRMVPEAHVSTWEPA